MKKLNTILIATMTFGSVFGQSNVAAFDFFEYKGMDSRFEEPLKRSKSYFNPILCGFYPDPSVCVKGKDFYLVNSSFGYFPGIPVFHSRDLVNWTQCGYVLERPEQLNLDKAQINEGIYAPSIAYNKHNNTFYVISTDVNGMGTFFVKSKNPMNGWSEPITLPGVGGIDPSFFFDEDGSAYIVHNDAPLWEPEWDGHRIIKLQRFDTETDCVVGEASMLVDGGVDRSKHPVWIEGPHLYKVNGKYFLMAAEGGTGTDHSEVIFTSDAVDGPYTAWSENPILTQRTLPLDREDPITSTGHADLIKTDEGEWYAVFLGCRPYEKDYYNTGRETFLLPVSWEEGYPVILGKEEAVPAIVNKKNEGGGGDPLSGNFSLMDGFDEPALKSWWNFIRTPRGEWWNVQGGELRLKPIGRNIGEITNPAFVGRRQQHTKFEVVTAMKFAPKSESDEAGVVCFQNEKHYIFFGKTFINDMPVLVVDRAEENIPNGIERVATMEYPQGLKEKNVQLKISGDGALYTFTASFDGGKTWWKVATDVDATNLSTHTAGGFVGVYIGMYATSKGVRIE